MIAKQMLDHWLLIVYIAILALGLDYRFDKSKERQDMIIELMEQDMIEYCQGIEGIGYELTMEDDNYQSQEDSDVN